jgi:hypothetical protein
MKKDDFISACIIPTGIGAEIGGFAGDASPYINLLSKVSTVITNPNSVNAAVFSGINENILYVEGFALDLFFKGEIALRPSKFNKIGVIFDKAIPQKVMNVHINTLNALKSTFGINIISFQITQEKAGVEFFISESGISTGTVQNPQTLIQAGEKLIESGAEALAIVCFLKNPENDENYANKRGIDPIGGIEAIISHILTREFMIPTAHAPAFDESSLNINCEIVDPPTAAEYITPTFLPCIVQGLYNAPKLIKINEKKDSDIIIDDLKALIMPWNSMGGIPVFCALKRNIPVIGIEENKTVLNVTPEVLGLKNPVISLKSYFEAAGYLLALRNGINIFTFPQK